MGYAVAMDMSTDASTQTSNPATTDSTIEIDNVKTDDTETSTDTPQPPHGYTEDKNAYMRRLGRIEGQIRGISRMVDEDKYCIDILTQISAVRSALQSVSVGLLEEHIGHCVLDAAKTSDEAGDAKVTEASNAIARLVKS